MKVPFFGFEAFSVRIQFDLFPYILCVPLVSHGYGIDLMNPFYAIYYEGILVELYCFGFLLFILCSIDFCLMCWCSPSCFGHTPL